MGKLYKYLIIFILSIIVLIGYVVRKDINNQLVDSDEVELSKAPMSYNSINQKSIKEQEQEDIEKLKLLSTVKLSSEDIENLNKTSKFLNFKQRVEQIFAQENPQIEPKEFNALMKEVDRLQKEQYFFLAEAHSLKLALLKTQYTGDLLNKKIDELVKETKSIDKNEREKYDPLNDPKFRLFKEQEKRIVEQANLMKNFPNGKTKDEYIEQQIKAIY